MIDYFVNTKEQQKLDLFQAILFSSNRVSSKELINTFEIKNETFRRHIKELQVDLYSLFNKKVILTDNDNKQFEIKFDDDLTLDYIITSLRINYMKNSSLYLLLAALIRKRYYSVSEIAYDLNFSEPTVYKGLAEIKELMLPFNVEFNWDGANNFKGDELGVRYFLYLTHWHLFNTLSEDLFSDKFPSEFKDISFLKSSLGLNTSMSKSQKDKLVMMSGIASYRIVFFKKYVPINSKLLNEIEFFYNGKYCLNIEQFNVSPEIIKNESMLFSFLARGLVSDLDSYEDKKIIVNKFLNSHLSIAKDVTFFLELFKNTFYLTFQEEEYINSYYILIFTFIYSKYFLFDIDNYLTVPISKNFENLEVDLKYQKLKPQFESFLKLIPFQKTLNNIQKETFIMLLYVIYLMNFQIKPVNLFITNTSNIVNPLTIKNTIKNIFNSNIFNFCSNINEADIIITSTYEGKFNSNNVFYFDNLYDNDSWKKLIHFLSNYLYDHNY